MELVDLSSDQNIALRKIHYNYRKKGERWQIRMRGRKVENGEKLGRP